MLFRHMFKIVVNCSQFYVNKTRGSQNEFKNIFRQFGLLSFMNKKVQPFSSVKSDSTLNNTDVENDGKSRIISKLNLKSENHAAPFYKLPLKTLVHILKTTQKDNKNGYCENRLYYIASKLKCPPAMLSERIAKRSFIYTLSFEWLESSLKVLLEMGVTPDRILRDLWVLKYHHKTIHDRLKKVKDLGIETLYPWMVRCSEDILNRYIEIYQETKTILGNDKSTKVYMCKRLNTSLDAVEKMYSKVPALERIRVSKVKNFLDFLYKEGFLAEDIISKPRILSASQITVKERLEKLRDLGLKEINLNILCRSRKGFKRYYEGLQNAAKDSENTRKEL